MAAKTKYIPRNDQVVIWMKPRGLTRGGLELPEMSAEGWRHFVVAVGPKVENLSAGDEVLVYGKDGSLCMINTEKDMYVTSECNIVCVVESK